MTPIPTTAEIVAVCIMAGVGLVVLAIQLIDAWRRP